MARHLMAVCVVCLLCAEHLPCHQHLDVAAALGAASTAAASSSSPPFGPPGSASEAAVPVASIAAQRYVNTLHLPNEWRDTGTDDSVEPRWRRARTKRHQPHSHSHGGEHDDDGARHQHRAPLPAKSFVQKLFERFGNAKSGGGGGGDVDEHTMNVDGFERMLHQLGLTELLHGGSGSDESRASDGAIEGSGSGTNATGGDSGAGAPPQCISSMDLVARVSSVHPPADSTNTGARHLNATALSISNTSTPIHSNQTAQAAMAAQAKQQLNLNAHDFAAICPILLYQLTSNSTHEKAGCIDEHLIASDFAVGHRHDATDDGIGKPEDRKLGE